MKNLLNEYKKLINIDKIPEFLIKYLETPSLIRLKDIDYFCGMKYASKNIYNFKEKITRYDHSLTTSLLIYKLTKDKKLTIAGLFHDISTPCFSHAIDYMNKDYEKEESTEEYTLEILKNDKLLLEYLKQDNIPLEEISNYKNLSIVDTHRPKLCADRLDGIILNSISWTKSITKNDIKEILNNTSIYNNENNEKEIGFISLKTAKKVLKLNDEINKKCHSKEDKYMMELLALITKLSIENNIIIYKDLYYETENNILNKLNNANNIEIQKLLIKFKTISLSEIKDIKIDNLKKRTINPIVKGKRLI